MKFKGYAVKTIITAIILLILAVLAIVFFGDIVNILLGILSILAPFIIAFILSLFLNPLAERLQKRFKLPRGLTAILVIILAVVLLGGVFGGIIYKVISEIKVIYTQLPEITDSIMQWIENVQQNLSHFYMSMPDDIQNIFDNMGNNLKDSLKHIINDNYKPVMHGAGNVAKKLPSIFIAIIVFILSLFFMVSGQGNVDGLIRKIIPKRIIEKATDIYGEIKKYLGGYVKAQLIIMSIAFVLIFTGLSILRIDYALLIALGVAVLDALPFFGSGAVLIPWSIISFISLNFGTGIGLLILYLSIIFTRQMIEPKIVSSKIGINPLVTLMSMYIGYRVFSIGGMILGPIVLVLGISFKKAGLFDPIIRFTKTTFTKLKEELK